MDVADLDTGTGTMENALACATRDRIIGENFIFRLLVLLGCLSNGWIRNLQTTTLNNQALLVILCAIDRTKLRARKVFGKVHSL